MRRLVGAIVAIATIAVPAQEASGQVLECLISGADSVCVGGTTSWCAPAGNLSYTWLGPNDFFASTQCVELSVAGEYTLTVVDLGNGIDAAFCSRTLGERECPAPSPTVDVCPAPARWWTTSCDGRAGGLDEATLAQVAAGVDLRSTALDFGGSAAGLCSVLRNAGNRDGVQGARRQYATVLANVVAAGMGVTASDGRNVGLDPAMSLDGIPDAPAGSTLGEWMAGAESALGISPSSANSLASHMTRRRIERQGRAINRGVGSNGCDSAVVNAFTDPEDEAAGGPLSPNTLATSGASLTTVPAKPFSGPHRLRMTLDRAEWVEVRVLDIAGRCVRHLASGAFAMGTHDLSWDGRDDDGVAVRSGAYFVAGRAGGEKLSQRLMLVR